MPYRTPLGLAVALGVLLAASAVHAALIVEATVSPLGGGVFHYEFSVTNNEAEDVAIVSITDAPIGDALIGPSLSTPAGFLGSYDAGLGFVDFLADADIFGVGTTKSGFSFDSESGHAPGVFSEFEALSIFGSFFSGQVQATQNVIPEPSAMALLAVGLCAWGLILARRKYKLAN
jgi:hypothetical protein